MVMFYPQQRQQMSEQQLAYLASQGNEQLSHAALQEMLSAQQGMQEVAEAQNIEVPKVNFYPSTHADPRKARKKDIKQAKRLLQPAKRSIFNPMRFLFGQKYRYAKDTGTCVVDGCNCANLIKHDNLYMRICDEDTGRSLWEMYWQNPVTGQPEAFVAQDKVTNGKKMKGTYCPEHLHLYHLLCKWEAEEDKQNEMNPSRLRDKVKRGVSIVTVPVASIKKKDPTPAMLQKYEPFFAELERDSGKTKGISVLHYSNPVTKQNDVTMVVFDLRIFQHEMEQMNIPTQQFQALLNQEAIKMQQNNQTEQNIDGSVVAGGA
tara:strand:+ start:582 stop:1535 length:954 start_codon:yes stop_codon:yes gene_type:complete